MKAQLLFMKVRVEFSHGKITLMKLSGFSLSESEDWESLLILPRTLRFFQVFRRFFGLSAQIQNHGFR